MRRVAVLGMVVSLLALIATPAAAQKGGGGGVAHTSVTPDGGSTTVASSSSGNSVSFTITNSSGQYDTYDLACSPGGLVTGCTPSVWSIQVAPSSSEQVSVSFDVGVGPGSGAVSLTATSQFVELCEIEPCPPPDHDSGDYQVTVTAPPIYSVAVSVVSGPDSLPLSSQGTVTFEVRNTGNQPDTYNLTPSVTGPGTPGGQSHLSIALGPNDAQQVWANINTGTATGEAQLTLTASGTASHQATHPITVYRQPWVALAYAPGDRLERSECVTTGAGPNGATQCGDLLYAHTLPAYRTLNRARSAALIHTSGGALPRSVVAVHVTLFAGEPVPDLLRVQIRRSSDGVITDDVFFSTSGMSGSQTATYRLVVPVAGLTGNLAEPIEALVWRKAGGVWESPAVVSARLLVTERSTSAFGAGWWLAGVDWLVSVPGGQLLIRGDGSPVFFEQSGSTFVAPAGEYSVLSQVGSGFRRKLPGDRVSVWYGSSGYPDSIVELQPAALVASYYWRANPNGNLTQLLDSIVDPTGRAIRFTYQTDRLHQILIPGVQPVTVYGTMNGSADRFRLDSIADPDGYLHRFTYDASYRMVTSQGRATGPVRYTYDPASRVDSIIPAAGSPHATSVLAASRRAGVWYQRAGVESRGPLPGHRPDGAVGPLAGGRRGDGQLHRRRSPAGDVVRAP